MSVEKALQVFQETGMGLKFTSEMPSQHALQFLDIKITFANHHPCWAYNPRSVKPLLSYKSGHSKIVKKGIATSTLGAAIQKSCRHQVEQSFSEQVCRLQAAGFPTPVITSVCEGLIRQIKKGEKSVEKQERSKKCATMPYKHRLAHGLKNVASRYDVQVLFSAGNKLGKLCPMVNKKHDRKSSSQNKCGVKHRDASIPCALGVVYRIPLTCKKAYIGQTGRCLYTRLKEHSGTFKPCTYANLPSHCNTCGCTPLYNETTVLFKHSDQMTRELVEAFYIKKEGESCVSQTSVSLHEKEEILISSMFV